MLFYLEPFRTGKQLFYLQQVCCICLNAELLIALQSAARVNADLRFTILLATFKSSNYNGLFELDDRRTIIPKAAVM